MPAPRGCGWSLVDPDKVDEAALKALGARGVMRPGGTGCRSCWARSPIRWRARSAARLAVVGALGGDANVRTVHALHGRFRVELADAGRVDEGALARLTLGIVRPRPDVCHILI
jgi:PTS system N-acetylglucosamine-specific IIC component